MFRLPLSVVSRSGRAGRLSVLIFHRVLRRSDPLLPDLPDAARFATEMQWVARWFNVLPLEEGVRQLYDGTIPARALSITFDDGYADNEEVAARLLRRLGLHATFFVSTGFLDGGCMWNDRVIEAVRVCPGSTLDLAHVGLGSHELGGDDRRRMAIGQLLKAIKHLEPEARRTAVEAVVQGCGAPSAPSPMMSPGQVRQLFREGMAIGAHTVSHPILSRLAAGSAKAEIQDSKRWLEDLLGQPGGVRLFAYPNGVPGQDYSGEHVGMVREAGFSAAVSTAWGAASRQSDRFQLPRFTPWDQTPLRYGMRMLVNLRRREATAA